MKTVKVRKSSEDSNEGVVDTNSDEEGGAEKVLSSSISMSRCQLEALQITTEPSDSINADFN